ncbi:MAG: hypothetical protein ABR515_02270 [Nitrososphaeraceae archaeon]
MEGKGLSDLQSAMTANQTYVNIMTSEHPEGEISGLIYAKSTSTETQDITGTSNTIEENAIEENAIEDNDEGDSEEDAEESEDVDAGGNED